MFLDDTIAAISTPPGEGGIGIVRLSGPDAIRMADALFRSASGKSLDVRGQRVFYGHICDDAGNVIDEALVQVMRAPRSYTREDVVEINGHGGAGPLAAILEAALTLGARLAGPGEFTQRAFVNGRIDLVQAEAVMDQIRARTLAGLQAANAAASGTLSRSLYRLRETVAEMLARIEVSVDFADEDVPDFLTREAVDEIRAVHAEMQALLATAERGRLVREGVSIAIAGRPNVGKSSLFNALLRDARAIVSAYAGTTRDRLEEYISLEGIPAKLIDMAGLRETEHEIERIGVERAREALRGANAALLVLDSAAMGTPEDRMLAEEIRTLEIPCVLVLNKCDLAPAVAIPDWADGFAGCCRLSALTGEGIAELEAHLGRLVLHGTALDAAQPMITHLHQKDSLRRASECVRRFLEGASEDVSLEFLAIELREALDAVGEITGETANEEILGKIFASFCVGK